jgi:hypothetical protein
MDVQSLQPDHHSWLGRNGWKLGFVFAAVFGGLLWRRSQRVRDISVGAVSERWLAEQAFEAGQRPGEA